MNRYLRILRQPMAAGTLIIVVSNAIALGGVWYNRSGEPDSVLELTERELQPRYDGGRDRDDTGLALSLVWRTVPADAEFTDLRDPLWLDSTRLVSLGFDITRSPADSGGRRHYQGIQPRAVLLVMEMDGPAAEAARARARAAVIRQEELVRSGADSNVIAPGMQRIHEQRIQERLRTELVDGSRLFVVDAGLDRPALRSLYPDRSRYAIARGSIGIYVASESNGVYRVKGAVRDVTPGAINVPKEFRGPLGGLHARGSARSTPSAPYAVSVTFGRRLEPWITDARRR